MAGTTTTRAARSATAATARSRMPTPTSRPRRTASTKVEATPAPAPVPKGKAKGAGLAATKSVLVDSRAAVEEVAAQRLPKRRKANPAPPPPPPAAPADGDAGTMPRAYQPSLLPLIPAFDLAAAVDHLISADPRFKRLFEVMPCRPFIPPYQAVDPFRTLATSIIGQQVSWLAARAINNRFRALFGYEGEGDDRFPSPADVVEKDVLVLKSAGLSLRKAEYVKSLAVHFLSGQLSTELLRDGSDEEITKALIAVRGIGQWTVDMFLIFSLRRANILPYGDLGVQKGLLRFALTAHGAFPQSKMKQKFVLGGKKAAKEKKVVDDKVDPNGEGELITTTRMTTPAPDHETDVKLPPTPSTPSHPARAKPVRAALHTPNGPGVSSSSPQLPPTPSSPQVKPEQVLEVSEKELPPPAPANEDLLEPMIGDKNWSADKVAPLGAGLSVEVLKSRWAGKKVKGGAYLTPEEMDCLTEGWKPFRSLGVYYTWAIADGSDSSI